MKGAQVGATEMGLNWLGYIIDNVPGPTLVVAPTVDMAKAQTKTRLDPMIASCPTISVKVSEPRSRDGTNTMMLKEFPGGFIGMTGANSGAALRSKPIKNLMLDEIDAYPSNVSGEGDPVNLALARTRTFPRRKIFMASTPTTAGRSRIEKAYQESEQKRFYVPCPKCGGYQVLKWSRVKWEPGKPREAWYECEHCACRIENWEKETIFSILKEEKHGPKPNPIPLHMMIMRAKANSQRCYEIYEFTSKLSRASVKTLFETQPQAIVDWIRKNGYKTYSDYVDEKARVVIR
jgi:phage terminase large subunit GpA-like protein